MSKMSLLIMSGAIGLFCASSEGVLAQAAPPNFSKTNMNEWKPPFSIPKSGNFTYRGKSPRGDVLMEVTWKASPSQPKADSVRIFGDVKYKNPKTGMMDSLVIDENKSYILKNGKLYFSVHAFSDKALGPVDLVALEGARRTKSDAPAKDTQSAPGSSAKQTHASEDTNQTTTSAHSATSDRSAKPAASSTTDFDEEVEGSSDDGASFSRTASASLPANRIFNDIFQAKGEFVPGVSKRLVIKWKQAKSIKGVTYPANSKAISYEIYLDEKKQSGWKLTGPAYLDKDGFAHVPVVSPGGIKHNYKSKDSFFSENFNTLVVAVNQIKKENAYIKNHKLNSLPYAIKDKKDNIIATDGTIILHAVIRSIKARNIAQKKSALSILGNL
jgi:hypothetical protein